MFIAFFNSISDQFHKEPFEAVSFDEKVDVCLKSVNEFLLIIEAFHGKNICQLEKCQIGLFLRISIIMSAKEGKVLVF